MALEELMLVNPKGKYPRKKSLQIVFPKPVKHMKVNPSAIDRVKEAGKGWKDVVGSGAVAVGGGLLVRQADKTNTNGKLSAIDDLGKEFDEILGLGQDEIDSDLLGDMGSLLNGGIANLGEEIVEK